MEFANDLLAALHGRVAPDAQSAGITGFDWSGLHARLVAAHAARAELARSDSRAVLLDGAFTDWSIAANPLPNGKRAVNLPDSTDGKGPRAIAGTITGQVMAGGRGQ